MSRTVVTRALTLVLGTWLLFVLLMQQQQQEDGQVSQPAARDDNDEPGSPIFADKPKDQDGIDSKLVRPEAELGRQDAASLKPGIMAPVKKHMDRAAVIIEPRPLKNLVPVLLHFHAVLGRSWPLIFYTTPATSQALLELVVFRRAISERRIEIRYLPPERTGLSSYRAVRLLRADPWLWEDLAPYKKILLFQADSIICSASDQTVDEFLSYDFIGAPMKLYAQRGFDDGLSLRNRELVLELLKGDGYGNDSTADGLPMEMHFGDQWLYTRMRELEKLGEGQVKLPDVATARKFAVATVWEEAPLGFCQPARWEKGKLDKIKEYCPEVGMISDSGFFE